MAAGGLYPGKLAAWLRPVFIAFHKIAGIRGSPDDINLHEI